MAGGDIELDESLVLIAADEAERGENAWLGLMFRATSGGSLAVCFGGRLL